MSKIQITVEVYEKDAKFFADLMRGAFAWAKYAALTIEAGDSIDATWLLRANVVALSAEKEKA